MVRAMKVIHQMTNVLRESAPITDLKISEGVADYKGHKPLFVTGIFQRADVLNANNRVYPRKLWERILSDPTLKDALFRRRVYGAVDHPADWKMSLAMTSHVITNLKMEANGDIVGTAEILPTPTGMVLEALFRANCEVGISSRGTGSTTKTNEGTEVVGEDYQLETFDFVAAPSTPGAYPSIVQEAIEKAKAIEVSKSELSPIKVRSYDAPITTEVKPMSLEKFRAAEREARELILTEGGGKKTRELLREKVEEKLSEILTLAAENRTVEAISAPIVKELTERRAALEH